MTDGSRPLLPPPVKVTASHDPRRLPPHRRRDSLAAAPPPWSCDAGEVVHHLLAARIAFRLRVRQTTIENRILLPELRRTGTTIEPETFSRAGAVARFAFRRGHDTPPGEPRRSTSPTGARLASRCLPLRVSARFGIAPALAFARACTAPAWGAMHRAYARSALRSSTELTTSSRRAVFRRPAAPSWQATWAEACEKPPVGSAKVPCVPTPQGSGTPRDPLLAEGPEHSLSSTRVRERLECRARVGSYPLADRGLRSRRPPRRRRRSRRPECLDPIRKNGAGEGLPLGNRSSDLRVTPPLAGHCHRGEPALGLPSRLAPP